MSRKNISLGLAGRLERYIYTLSPGSRLPAEQGLAEIFKVSKPTLRRALGILREDGCIATLNGVGNVVLKAPDTFQRELVFVCSDLVFFGDTLKNFSEEVANSSYFCSVIPLSGTEETQYRILRSVFERKVAGIVLYPGALDLPRELFASCKAPVLHLVRRHSGLDGDLLSFRNEEGFSNIVKHFYGKNCRRFALFGTRVNLHAARERMAGFKEGLRKVRLRMKEELICHEEKDYERFFATFREPGKRPHAVCCLNDQCAGEFFMEMKKRDLSWEDLEISGFDCSPVSRFYPRSILSVKLPLAELGHRAAQLLIRRIENPTLTEITEKLSPELVYTQIQDL